MIEINEKKQMIVLTEKEIERIKKSIFIKPCNSMNVSDFKNLCNKVYDISIYMSNPNDYFGKNTAYAYVLKKDLTEQEEIKLKSEVELFVKTNGSLKNNLESVLWDLCIKGFLPEGEFFITNKV